jgi:putative DNA primase/helicase
VTQALDLAVVAVPPVVPVDLGALGAATDDTAGAAGPANGTESDMGEAAKTATESDTPAPKLTKAEVALAKVREDAVSVAVTLARRGPVSRADLTSTLRATVGTFSDARTDAARMLLGAGVAEAPGPKGKPLLTLDAGALADDLLDLLPCGLFPSLPPPAAEITPSAPPKAPTKGERVFAAIRSLPLASDDGEIVSTLNGKRAPRDSRAFHAQARAKLGEPVDASVISACADMIDPATLPAFVAPKETDRKAARPSLTEDGYPVICIGPDLHRVVNEAETALSADADLYARGGTLVRVVPREVDARSRVNREPGTPAIRAMVAASVRDRLSAVAAFAKYDGRSGEYIQCSPPKEIAEALLARGSWPSLRPLAGVATSQIVRPDGSIAQSPGYDPATGFLLAFDPGERIPNKPTKEQSFAARDRVLALVADFPFATKADRSAWLALALTLVCRAAVLGPVPLWIIIANLRATGKSKLVDLLALILTGRAAARATHPADEAEFGKVLTSIAIEADALVLFDNVDRPFGGGKVDAWLTGERWADRPLGTNVRTNLPIVTVLAATGNNLEVRGDTLRRVLPVRLESALERPEARTDFKIPDLLGHVREHRAELVRAVVMMAAGWFTAGRPKAKEIPTWGSFESWTSIIPHMLRWLELPDPMATREGLEDNDPTLAALRTLLASWTALELRAGTIGLTGRELVDRVYHDGKPHDGLDDLAAALETLAPGSGRERVDVKRLGYVLRQAKGRRIGGKRLVRATRTAEGAFRWTVNEGLTEAERKIGEGIEAERRTNPGAYQGD